MVGDHGEDRIGCLLTQKRNAEADLPRKATAADRWITSLNIKKSEAIFEPTPTPCED